MDTDKPDNPIKEVLDELFTLLESLESQNAAVLTFLKDQNIVTDEKFAPYLNRAETASSVKWRAARARMAYLLAPAPKKATDQTEKSAAKEPQGKEAAPKETVPKDAAAKDSEPKAADRKTQETKDSDQKQPESQGPEPKAAPQKGNQVEDAEPKNATSKTEKHKANVGDSSDSDASSSSGNDQAKHGTAESQTQSPEKAGSQQEIAKQNANSKAASAGRGDESNPPRNSKSQDVSAQPRK